MMHIWKFLKLHRHYVFIFLVLIFSFIGLKEIIKPLCIVLFLSYFFNKPVTYLERYYISRRVSTFALIGILVYLILTVMIYVIPLLSQKIVIIIQKSPFILDNFIEELEPWIRKFAQGSHPEYMEKIKDSIKEEILRNLQHAAYYSLAFVTHLVSIKTVIYYFVGLPFLTYYLTVDWPHLTDYVLSVMPKKIRGSTRDLLLRGEQMFSNYIHGQTLVCIILSVLYAISLFMIDFKNPVIVGMLVGFLIFIPYLGAVLGFLIILIFMMAEFYTFKMFVQLCSIVAVLNIFESQLLAPYIIGKKLGTSPILLILALVVGNYYFGLIGMVLSYPVTATIISTWQIAKEKYQL